MYNIIVIGASLGGLHALNVVLSALPAAFKCPIVIVQHRKPDADEMLVALLQERCHLPVREAEDKDPLAPGRVYLAPSGYHLLVERGTLCVALSTEAPVNYARPSIDVLFESAARAYGARVVGVLLTGANEDGAAGMQAIKRAGGLTVAQDPADAEARTMPEAAIKIGAVDMILPLEEMGKFLAELH